MKGTFDEALECLRGTGSEVADGVAPNHGPMAAEALVALGRDDVVVAWARRYRRKLDAMPSPSSPISSEGWPQALGATDRFADWVAFFSRANGRGTMADCVQRVDRSFAARDAFGRRPRTHSHCARSACAVRRRDTAARRRARSCLGILGCLLPYFLYHPAPRGYARSRRGAPPR